MVPEPDRVYSALAELRRRKLARVGVEWSPVELSLAELRCFSQNGEDGVLDEILARIGTKEEYFVEFGIEGGAEGNTIFLADVMGWSGLYIEASAEHFEQLQRKYGDCPQIQTVRAMVTPENIETLLDEADVPVDFDVLSIDIDSVDYWVWAAIRSRTPRIVVVEYNASLDVSPARAVTVPSTYRGPWDGTAYFGASLGALSSLAESKGYQLVHTDLTWVNAFFVRNDLVDPFASSDVRRRTANYFFTGAGHPPSATDDPFVEL